jgi:hypothetical protein
LTKARKRHLTGPEPVRPNLSMTLEIVQIIAASYAATGSGRLRKRLRAAVGGRKRRTH